MSDDSWNDSLQRPRPLFCFAAGIAGAAVVVAIFATAGPLFRSLKPWLADHWIWLLLPVISILIGLLARLYILTGGFDHDGNYHPLPILKREVGLPSLTGYFAGTICAFLICFEVDGSFMPWNAFVRLFPGDSFGFWGSVAIALGLAYVLRRHGSPGITWREGIWALLLLGLAAAIICVIALGVTSVEFSSATAGISSQIATFWPAVALGIAFSIQLIWWAKNPDLGSEEYSASKRMVRFAAVGLFDFLLLMYTVLYWLPGIVVDTTGLSRPEAATALARERQTLLAITAAIGAGLTLIYTHLRHQLDRDANATGRYAEAVQQLGSENMSIRLGGIYALGRVAKDSRGDRDTIFQLLASFVKDRGGTMDDHSGQVPGGSIRTSLDVIAALKLLGEDWLISAGPTHIVELRGWDMENAGLRGVKFPFLTDLTRANLLQANLRGSTFDTCNLNLASLAGADLQDARIDDSAGESVNLSFAVLRETTVRGCDFQIADLFEAKAELMDASHSIFKDASFVKADLSFARFSETDLSGCDFDEADLTGADLTKAKIHGATFRGAIMRHAILKGHDIDGLQQGGAIGINEAYTQEDADPGDEYSALREKVVRRINPRQ